MKYHNFNIYSIPITLDDIESLLGDTPEDIVMRGEIDFFRGYFKYFQNDARKSIEYLEKALKRVPSTYKEIRGQIEILHGLALQMDGRKSEAVKEINDLLSYKKSSMGVRQTRLLVTLVYIYIISGELDEAFEINQQLLNFSKKENFHYAESWGYYLRGLINFYWDDPEEAIKFFSKCLKERHIMHTRANIDAMTGLILSYYQIGQPEIAMEKRDLLKDYIVHLNDPVYSMTYQSIKISFSLALGEEVTPPKRYDTGSLQSIENMVWWLENNHITYCKALLAHGSDGSLRDAEEILTGLLNFNRNNHNILRSIEIMSLLALVRNMIGHIDESLETLDSAIKLAEPGGVSRFFSELGNPMAEMIKILVEKNGEKSFYMKLLSSIEVENQPEEIQAKDISFPGKGQPSQKPESNILSKDRFLVEDLTNRELDILEMLEQRLQNKEIADKLFISPETVKAHLKNIYQKLDASNRRQAVVKAKELGIL
jgi:LuxR family maltose regulon positive regulatory protein